MGNQDKEVSMTPKRRHFLRLFKNNSHVSMRNLATVALLLFGSMTVARADVLTHTAVKVTGVNQKAHSFTVRWKALDKSDKGTQPYYGDSREATFKTNDKTTYWVGSSKGSWASVTKGVRVNVTAHSEGSDKVVDKVQIVSGS
jgi:hypothetical protein